jgi:hypothetical protein
VLLSALERALAPHGLNLVGATAAAAYDACVPPEYALCRLLPDARAMIVIGNGGAEFWGAYRAYCARHQTHEGRPDPLDRFTQIVIEDVVRPLVGGEARIFYPFRFADEPVSFLRLAECAGLGRPGLTGVLLHPVFGPWIAFRAAIAVPFHLAAPRPSDGFDPCPTCVERACMPACPAGAVTARGWDIPRCAAERARDPDPCAARCHARFECVLGREHRYPADALAHHQTWARPALVARGAGLTLAGAREAPARAPGRAPTPRA